MVEELNTRLEIEKAKKEGKVRAFNKLIIKKCKKRYAKERYRKHKNSTRATTVEIMVLSSIFEVEFNRRTRSIFLE